MCLNLVHGRDDLGLGDEVLELVDREIADAYRADFPGVYQLLQSSICVGWVDVCELEDALFVDWEPFVA